MSMSELKEQSIVQLLTESILFLKNNIIEINISNRHIHLCQEDFEALFGKGYKLTKIKPLKQPGQYACKETVTIKGPNGIIENVRILGPIRKYTQVEILRSDIFKLGIDAPVKLSGNVENTPGIIVMSSNNAIRINQGVMIAKRHIHMTEKQAELGNYKNGQEVMVKIDGERGLTLEHVSVRVSNNNALEMHVDVDEANACGIGNKAEGLIIV